MSEEYFDRGIHICVHGGQKNVRKSLIEPLFWCANKLFPKHTLYIDVQLKKLGTEYLGFCWPTDDNNSRPREYQIEINKALSINDMIKTLFHEMVHVDQYARNKLAFRERPVSHRLWLGEVIEEGAVDYWKLPWEVEAFSMQDVLFDEWSNINR